MRPSYKAPPAVLSALSDPEPNVRRSVAWALFNIRDASTLPALEAAFAKEADPGIQVDLIRAIGATGESSVDALSRLVSSPTRGFATRQSRHSPAVARGGPWPMPRPQPRPTPN